MSTRVAPPGSFVAMLLSRIAASHKGLWIVSGDLINPQQNRRTMRLLKMYYTLDLKVV